MVKNILRAFFVILVIVGGVWWWKGWKLNKQGEITPEATQIKKEVVSSPTPEPRTTEMEAENHEPVETGVGDWQLGIVLAGSFGAGLLMWGLYKATYRVYWLDG